MHFRKRMIEVEPIAMLAVVSTAALVARWGRVDDLSGVPVRRAHQRHGKR